MTHHKNEIPQCLVSLYLISFFFFSTYSLAVIFHLPGHNNKIHSKWTRIARTFRLMIYQRLALASGCLFVSVYGEHVLSSLVLVFQRSFSAYGLHFNYKLHGQSQLNQLLWLLWRNGRIYCRQSLLNSVSC